MSNHSINPEHATFLAGPGEIEELKIRIETCFFKFVIEDPYPQISGWEMEQEFWKREAPLRAKIKKQTRPKPEVSAHEAWKDGFEFAKNLVLKELKR